MIHTCMYCTDSSAVQTTCTTCATPDICSYYHGKHSHEYVGVVTRILKIELLLFFVIKKNNNFVV